MSGSRTIARLLWCYPAPWRARYGDELEGLILEMSDGRRVPWRVRADVVGAGGRERLRAAGVIGDGPASTRVRAGAVLVMWAWALFVLGGAVLAKSTEHWQSAMPAGAGHSTATVTFTTLIAVAVTAALLVLAGIGLALPSLLSFLRDGGWRDIRGRILAASGLTAALIVVTGGLAAWAHGLTPSARNGHDMLYGVRVPVLGGAVLGHPVCLDRGCGARGARPAPGDVDAAASGPAGCRGDCGDGRDRGRHRRVVGGRGHRVARGAHRRARRRSTLGAGAAAGSGDGHHGGGDRVGRRGRTARGASGAGTAQG